MAKPIKATPLLRGKDAINFIKTIEENRNKKVSNERIMEIREVANKFKSILKTR